MCGFVWLKTGVDGLSGFVQNNIEMMERLREQEREREEQDAKMGALKAFIITAPPKRAMPKQRSGRYAVRSYCD